MGRRTEDPKARPTTWDGGFIRYDVKGRPTYYLNRMIGGVLYRHSTRTHGIRAALEHLKRFEEAPSAYNPAGLRSESEGEQLFLEAKLAEDFLHHSEHEKGNTAKWVRNQRLYLADWAEDLAGLDLRKLSLRDHVIPALDRRKTARKFRIEVLKVFFGWMRKTRHLLSSAQDPTLDLTVPQGSPEKNRRRKIIPVENVFAAREHLAPKVRDALDVLLATAWHGTELQRFAKEGDIVERPPNANVAAWPEGVAGVLIVKQKTGGAERWSVRAEALDAAKRIRRGGAPNERWINRTIAAACELAKVPVFTYGPLRHSVLTWAREAGASVADIAEDLAHHKDPRTTRRFYLDVAVPRLLPTVK